MDQYKFSYRNSKGKQKECIVYANTEEEGYRTLIAHVKYVDRIFWVEHLPAYPIGQAFRLLKQGGTPDGATLPAGYLVYREKHQYRGEDGRVYGLYNVENNPKTFWPVSKKTIKKLNLA